MTSSPLPRDLMDVSNPIDCAANNQRRVCVEQTGREAEANR